MADVLDFHGKNVRGRSFEGHDLSGADFSQADVRGADFSNAVLREASFEGSLMGVTVRVGVTLLVVSMLVSVATGAAIGLFWLAVIKRAASSDWRDVFAALLAGAAVIAFLGVLIGKGLRTAFRIYVLGFSAAVLFDMAVTYAIAGELRLTTEMLDLFLLFVLFVPAALAGVLARITGGEFGAWSLIVVAATGGWAAGRTSGGVAAVVVMGILVVLARRALKADQRDQFLRGLSTTIVARFGTRFRGADLSGANFCGVAVDHADLTDATTTGTVWDEATDHS